MKQTNIAISFIILISMISYSSLSYGAKSTSLADIISNNVFDVRLADRCGDVIPSDRKAFDRCKKQSGGPEKFPPIASEACAYDRVGDILKLSFDEAQVSVDDVTTHINIYDENDVKIYDNQIEQLPFVLYEKKKRVESWPLTNQTGGQLQVGRQGKKYTAQIERRKQGDIRYTTGIMDIFVDDCQLRNEKILELVNDSGIFHTPGFNLYLKLLNRVSDKICNKIKTGLLGTIGADTFSQRCRYQCINNSFANELINSTSLPLSSGVASTSGNKVDYLNNTHIKVNLQSAEEIHFVDNDRWGNGWINERFALLAYISMEDNYRADGYLQCNGPLNAEDIQASINLIQEAVDEIVIEIPSLGLTGIAEKILRQIPMHLNRTQAIYERNIGGQ